MTVSKTSTLTTHQTHGAFFWGDGAGACVVTRGLSAAETGRFQYDAYAEANSSESVDAMYVPLGDDVAMEQEARIRIRFPDERAKRRYIRNERSQFGEVMSELEHPQLVAVCLPSTGQDRLPGLLGNQPELKAKVVTDWSWPHTGAVDVLLQAAHLSESQRLGADDRVALLSPAFTAQWGGVRLRWQQGDAN